MSSDGERNIQHHPAQLASRISNDRFFQNSEHSGISCVAAGGYKLAATLSTSNRPKAFRANAVQIERFPRTSPFLTIVI
jgi:hypothetical protein